MKSRFKLDPGIVISFMCLFVISIISIYSAESLLKGPNTLYIKQLFIYLAGFVMMFFIIKTNKDFFMKYAKYGYLLGILSLILVLFFGTNINNAKCWFVIPYFGNIQPSEFMKIFLIIYLAKIVSDFKEKTVNPTVKDEFFLLLRVFIIVLIPSFLTFLEPDTGAIFMYFVITLAILFISGIRLRWFLLMGLIIIVVLGTILGLFFLKQDLFVSLLGTDFFYRIDRILNWQVGSGMQLENALMAIGSAHYFGYGFNSTPIYFPEPQTDFIFAVATSNFGFIGSSILISLFLYFDLSIINIGIKASKNEDKFIVAGFVGMLLYQQFQNMGMTLGLLPITGITLPFISYGGSSLLSYLIILGIILNIVYYNHKYTN